MLQTPQCLSALLFPRQVGTLELSDGETRGDPLTTELRQVLNASSAKAAKARTARGARGQLGKSATNVPNPWAVDGGPAPLRTLSDRRLKPTDLDTKWSAQAAKELDEEDAATGDCGGAAVDEAGELVTQTAVPIKATVTAALIERVLAFAVDSLRHSWEAVAKKAIVGSSEVTHAENERKARLRAAGHDAPITASVLRDAAAKRVAATMKTAASNVLGGHQRVLRPLAPMESGQSKSVKDLLLNVQLKRSVLKMHKRRKVMNPLYSLWRCTVLNHRKAQRRPGRASVAFPEPGDGPYQDITVVEREKGKFDFIVPHTGYSRRRPRHWRPNADRTRASAATSRKASRLQAKSAARRARRRIAAVDPGVRDPLTIYDSELASHYSVSDGNYESSLERLATKYQEAVDERHAALTRIAKGGLSPDDEKEANETVTRLNVQCTKLVAKRERTLRAYHYHISGALVRRFDVILMPDFRVSGMIRKRRAVIGGHRARRRKISKRTVKKMLSFRHSDFLRRLKTTANATRGCTVDVCDEINTTKACTHCGAVNENVGAKKRLKCQSCKRSQARDGGAARNVLLRRLTLMIRFNAPAAKVAAQALVGVEAVDAVGGAAQEGGADGAPSENALAAHGETNERPGNSGRETM